MMIQILLAMIMREMMWIQQIKIAKEQLGVSKVIDKGALERD